MGREIRRVPANWVHPENDYCRHLGYRGLQPHHGDGENDFTRGKCFKPLYDRDYDKEAHDWVAECIAWENGTHPELIAHPKYKENHPFFVDYAGVPPDKEFYHPKWSPEEATHYQVYETVSEGTPVSPVFATLEELTDWLVGQGYSREAADAFAKDGWAVSFVVQTGTDAGIYDGIEAAALK